MTLDRLTDEQLRALLYRTTRRTLFSYRRARLTLTSPDAMCRAYARADLRACVSKRVSAALAQREQA